MGEASSYHGLFLFFGGGVSWRKYLEVACCYDVFALLILRSRSMVATDCLVSNYVSVQLGTVGLSEAPVGQFVK